MTMELTDAERAVVIAQLKDEALTDVKRRGCTCEPRWSLTEQVFGRYQLPAWLSEHDDDCALSEQLR